MKIVTLILFALAQIITGCGEDSGTDPVDTTPRLRFSPDAISLSEGGEGYLDFVAENLPIGIFAISMQITFNSQVVYFGEGAVVAGGYFDEQSLVFSQSSESSLHLAITNTRGAVNGGYSGTLFQLHIMAGAAGASSLDVAQSNLSLYDESGEILTIENLEILPATVSVTN